MMAKARWIIVGFAAIILAVLAFGAFVWARYGSASGLEYLTGYVIEKSLSVDNIFVFVVIFGSLGIPALYQHRVLFWGIVSALVLRGAMIAGGAEELCVTEVAVFDTLFATSVRNDAAGTTPRPFDAARDGLVLGEGARLAIAGVVLGSLAAWTLARALTAVVYEVTIGDPLIWLGVATIVAATTLAACWSPARRAARVDPVELLRDA